MKPRFLLAATAAILLTTGAADAQMSESERKSAARAAYREGVELQDKGKPKEALARFQAAEKLYDAPTHLLHIAETQALTGQLVEANETYESLIHQQLGADASPAFVQAQHQAEAEQPALKARIPTLKVTIASPARSALSNLQIHENNEQIPVELLGIERPVNPGTYSISATATGYATAGPTVVTLREKESKQVALALQPGAATTVPVVTTPVGAGAEPARNARAPEPYKETPRSSSERSSGSSSTGLLVGGRAGVFVPGGSLAEGQKMSDTITAGAGFGLDIMARLAHMLLLGGTFELASLGTADSLKNGIRQGIPLNSRASFTVISTYLGLTAGIVPNIDEVSFIGDVGLGIRSLSQSVKLPNGAELEQSFSGPEFAVRAGLSIPAGPIRIVPMAGLNIGSFTNATTDCTGLPDCFQSGSIENTAGHTVFFVGLAVYFHADLGKKKPPTKTSSLPALAF